MPRMRTLSALTPQSMSRNSGIHASLTADISDNRNAMAMSSDKTPKFGGFDNLDFTCLSLTCPINADDISNRWMSSFMPLPGQQPKNYSAPITSFILRVLKSYVAVTVSGRGIPPFVHPCQSHPRAARQPLATCLSLVRMCNGSISGSENNIRDILEREMNSVYDQRDSYEDLVLLAAFQAHLIYTMTLFFKLGEAGESHLRQAMMNLQHLACICARRGLVCTAEHSRTRPSWESWIIAEAKRRTLYIMYLFDSVLLARDGLPTFLGTELAGLPAPGSKMLWEASSREEWERAYNTHLADSPDGSLRIDELWPVPEGLTEQQIVERRERADQWLEGLDEFGTMLYAVTSCTHLS